MHPTAGKALREILSRALGSRSQVWLAGQCGVSQGAVSQWLSGKVPPSARSLALIAVALGLDGRELARIAGRDPDRVARQQSQLAGMAGGHAGPLIEVARLQTELVYLTRISGNPHAAVAMAQQIAAMAGQPISGSRIVVEELLSVRGRALFEWATALRETTSPMQLGRTTRPVVAQMRAVLDDLTTASARGELTGLINVTEGQVAYIARHPELSIAHLREVGLKVDTDEQLINRRTVVLNWAKLGQEAQVDRWSAQSHVRLLEQEARDIIGLGSFRNAHTVVLTLEGFGRARAMLGMERVEETFHEAEILNRSIRVTYPLLSIQIARSRLRAMLCGRDIDRSLYEKIAAEGRREAIKYGYARYVDQFDGLIREFNDGRRVGPTGRGFRARTTAARSPGRAAHPSRSRLYRTVQEQ